MKLRFLADANLDQRIVSGVKRLASEIDFVDANRAGLRGLSDPHVPKLAADQGRILVSHDCKTLPRHFSEFTTEQTCPGVILLRQNLPLKVAIEELHLIWAASQSVEYENRLVWLPL